MKKSLIFITVISLLITLFIPNIALAQEPSLSIEKTGDAGPVSIGDTIDYTITVTNNYTGHMAWIYVVDEKLGIYYEIPILYPGESVEIIGTYGPVTEDDLPGPIVNTAMATWPYGEEHLEGEFTVFADHSVSIEITPEPEPKPKPIIPEPCYCSLVVQIRDEAGHPINGAVLKVDGIEKKTVNGDARWDNLKCDTSYTVRELKPEKRTEGIHLGSCGERSTMRIVHKIKKVEVVVEEVIIPEAGLDLNFTTLYTIVGLGILRILLGIKRKRK